MIKINPTWAIVLHQLEKCLGINKMWVIDRAADGELVRKAFWGIASKYGMVQARGEVTRKNGLAAIPSKVKVLQPSTGLDQEQQQSSKKIPTWHGQISEVWLS